jgi:3-methyladenine DNA glycosylase AlkD
VKPIPGMNRGKPSPSRVASQIRRFLEQQGSAEHAKGVQWFFKEEIKSHGWYTAELRRGAVQTRRDLQKEFGLPFVVQTADKLFSGRVLEEKVFAVFLLERLTDELGDKEFKVFESWLDRVSSWADHDALVHYLIAPMIFAKPRRLPSVFKWSKSPDRWHRRAACVSLIHGTRQKKFFPQISRLSSLLLDDNDDMVQKGLGWLLRESAKANPAQTVPFLLKIRTRAPRLVLRTACETLLSRDRARILNQRLQ